MAYVVQKIMGKRLGHYWRKVVWILLTIKMCFPFWSVTEKFRQHFFIISMPAYYMGEQNQKTAIMTKIGNVSIREWMSGEKFLPYIWLAGMILCLLFHAIQYRIWKKRIFAECKKMHKNSVLEALKKASEVCKIKKTEIWVHGRWNNRAGGPRRESRSKIYRQPGPQPRGSKMVPGTRSTSDPGHRDPD